VVQFLWLRHCRAANFANNACMSHKSVGHSPPMSVNATSFCKKHDNQPLIPMPLTSNHQTYGSPRNA
jgi:hypothetical protein